MLKHAALAAILLSLAHTEASACACGCGIFDVGTSSMLPNGSGGMGFLEYAYQNQNQNWSGSSRAPAADNPDRDLSTDFVTAGAQYMFNRSWGAQIEVPYDHRSFETTTADGDLARLNWSAWGDLRLTGLYTGLSEDMSIGLTYGLKLPTGDWRHNDAAGDIDRDSELGTGSTDLLLGGFFRHQFQSNAAWTSFAQVSYDQPFHSQDQYRPGAEVDAATGLYYDGWFVARRLHITPIGQILGSWRATDTGANAASPVASGYRRLLLSPGLELHVHPVSVYADVEVPVLQHFTGNQLSAPVLFKVIVSYMF